MLFCFILFQSFDIICFYLAFKYSIIFSLKGRFISSISRVSHGSLLTDLTHPTNLWTQPNPTKHKLKKVKSDWP